MLMLGVSTWPSFLALLMLGVASGSGVPNAYFLLTFDMLARPDWPAKYANVSLFIASPTHFDDALVAQVQVRLTGRPV